MLEGELLQRAEDYGLDDVKFVYDETNSVVVVEQGGDDCLLEMVREFPVLLIEKTGEVEATEIASELFDTFDDASGTLPKYNEAVVLSNIISGKIITIEDVADRTVTLSDGTSVNANYYIDVGDEHYFAELQHGVFWYGVTYTSQNETTEAAFVLQPKARPDPTLEVQVVDTSVGKIVCIGDTPIAVAENVKGV